MQKMNSKDFISVIGETKPPLIIFREINDPEADKIEATLKELKSDFPLLNIYQYFVDESEDNSILAENLGIDKTPLLNFYKNSNFSRYKDKQFTKKALTTFIGSKKTYAKPTEGEK